MKRSISQRTSVTWTNNTLSPKPNRSETLPTYNSNNQRRESVSVKRIPSAKRLSRSTLLPIYQKSLNETELEKSIEQIDAKTPIKSTRPVTAYRMKQTFNQSEYSFKSPNDLFTNKEFTPLYSTKTDTNQLETPTENTRAVKYHFRSIEDTSNKQTKIHRSVSFLH